MKWRVLLGAFLVYVALDLSLPAMPGAFVFDVGDSVEGTHGGRNRLVSSHAIAPAMAGQMPIVSEPRVGLPQRLPPSRVVRQSVSAEPALPRAACARPPASDDPH
jgi:hypothetical protein